MGSVLDDLCKEINKKYGAGTIATASEAKALDLVRIPTGVLNVDVGFGGGLPRGRFVTIKGHFSSGKTWLSATPVPCTLDHCGNGHAFVQRCAPCFPHSTCLGIPSWPLLLHQGILRTRHRRCPLRKQLLQFACRLHYQRPIYF